MDLALPHPRDDPDTRLRRVLRQDTARPAGGSFCGDAVRASARTQSLPGKRFAGLHDSDPRRFDGFVSGQIVAARQFSAYACNLFDRISAGCHLLVSGCHLSSVQCTCALYTVSGRASFPMLNTRRVGELSQLYPRVTVQHLGIAPGSSANRKLGGFQLGPRFVNPAER
jgi:hypothetical protein